MAQENPSAKSLPKPSRARFVRGAETLQPSPEPSHTSGGGNEKLLPKMHPSAELSSCFWDRDCVVLQASAGVTKSGDSGPLQLFNKSFKQNRVNLRQQGNAAMAAGNGNFQAKKRVWRA